MGRSALPETTPGRVARTSGATRMEARFLHVANLLVAVTGIGYAVYRWLVPPLNEYALAHPGQAAWQHVHVLSAPLLLFGIGLIWRTHIWRFFRSPIPARRRTGWLLLFLVVPMVASGYLLQTSVSDGWRTAWSWVHVGASTLWVVGYCAHQWADGVRRRERG